jgi:hypothetical protein
VTYAICIKCGEGKLGAFTACRKCGFTPTADSDRAQSIVLSDHISDETTLQVAAGKLKAGETLEFDEPAMTKMAEEMAEIAKHPPADFNRGCAVYMWSLIGIAVLLFLLNVVLIWYARS